MWLLLFFLNIFLSYTLCLNYIDSSRGIFTRLREGFIHASLVFALFTWTQVQVLSAFDALNFTGVSISQVLFLIVLIFLIRLKTNAPFEVYRLALSRKQKLFLVCFLIFFLVPILYLCLFVPPNNADASTCYLIRVEYWVKNNNIHHYPTQNLFELYYNQFPQFFIVNARILSGTDYFTSIFQFFAYIGSALTASLIVKELGPKDTRTQILAAMLCLCLPQAILQSSAAMYDLQSAYAASVSIYFLLRILKNSDKNFTANALCFATAFAFTSYIKYSSVFFIVLFPVWICINLLRRSPARFIVLSFLVPCIFIIIHLSFFIENYSSFGSPVTPPSYGDKKSNLVNETISPATMVSGLTKNLAINLVTPLPAINDKLYNAVLCLHSITGIDVNDSRINLNQYYEHYSAAISESTSGNLNTMILVFLVLLLSITKSIRKKFSKKILIYCLCLLAGFLVFSVVFKFQSWNARLQLPFFILLTAPLSALLSGLFGEKKYFFSLIICFLLVSSLPFVYMNYGKPIISYHDLRKLLNKPPHMLNAREFASSFEDTKLLQFYTKDSASLFINLRPGLTSIEKREVFATLDSLHYFLNEQSVLAKSRNQNYLVPGYQNSAMLLANYDSLTGYLYRKIQVKENPVGLVLGHSPEYPLMAMIRDFPSDTQLTWEHIRYIPVKNENDNFRRTFAYEWIVTNDSNFISHLKSPYKRILQFGLIQLIELNDADTTLYRIGPGGIYYMP